MTRSDWTSHAKQYICRKKGCAESLIQCNSSEKRFLQFKSIELLSCHPHPVAPPPVLSYTCIVHLVHRLANPLSALLFPQAMTPTPLRVSSIA